MGQRDLGCPEILPLPHNLSAIISILKLMPPEIVALIDNPVLLAIVLTFGALLGAGAERLGENFNKRDRRAYWERRQQWRGRGNKGSTSGWQKSSAVPLKAMANRPTQDAAEQLRLVMEAQFNSCPLLNKSERRLLTYIDKALADLAPGWRAMAQVSLGEILASDDRDAFGAVNSKRVDFLIIDTECRPLHAVEFQGSGHHQGTAAARDAVKKEALRRAGIGYVEVVSGDTPADVRAMVQKLVARATFAHALLPVELRTLTPEQPATAHEPCPPAGSLS
ncbi:MAG: DUF2726 domain-containing protein [Novosphingobium sp.]